MRKPTLFSILLMGLVLHAPLAAANPCNISQVSAIAKPCTPGGDFYIELNFNFEQTGQNGFTVEGNGHDYGSFHYGELPIQLGPFAGNGATAWEFAIIDKDNENCRNSVELGTINCHTACTITKVQAEAYPCNEEGNFFADVWFEVEHPGAKGFRILGSNTHYGDFDYGQPYYTIGPLAGESALLYEFIVQDLENPDCISATFLEEPVHCPETGCLITELDLAVHEQCNDDGTINLYLAFEVENGLGSGFDLFINGAFHSHYAEYPDPFINVIGVDAAGKSEITVGIVDNDHPECSIDVTRPVPECEQNAEECQFSGLIAEAYPCDGNGEVLLDISFLTPASHSEHFTVKANGQEFGPFPYGEDFYTIGPFKAVGQHLPIHVKDQGDPHCYQKLNFKMPDCEAGQQCKLQAALTHISDCEQGAFSIQYTIETTEPASEGFFIWIKDRQFGPFAYEDTPMELQDIPSFDHPNEIKFIDKSNEDCYFVTSLTPPACEEAGEEACELTDVFAEAHPCKPDGTFLVDLAFEVRHPVADGFFIHAQDQSFGPFEYGQTFYTFGPLRTGAEQLKITVYDAEEEGCHGYFELAIPVCEQLEADPEPCRIYELTATAGDCQTDESFLVLLDFKPENPGDQGFTVKGNGRDYGNFQYEDLPLTLGPFNGNEQLELEFVVIDISNPDCRKATVLEPADCSPRVWPGDANDDQVVDQYDLLNIGLAYEQEGPARAATGTDWTGFVAPNWNQSFADGTNFKFADANGNGIIDADDADALRSNYGRSHGTSTAPGFPAAAASDPPLFVDLPESLNSGQSFSLPVVLGIADQQVEAIYGLAFSIRYDPDIINAGSLELDFSESWLGRPTETLLTLVQHFPEKGVIDLAISRKDRVDVKGAGPVVILTGIIEDDILGRVAFEIEGVRALRADEQPVKLYTPLEEIDLFASADDSTEEGILAIYPNPAKRTVYLRNLLKDDIVDLRIYDAVGRLVLLLPAPGNAPRIDIDHWHPGLYLIKVKYEHAELTKKLIIH